MQIKQCQVIQPPEIGEKLSLQHFGKFLSAVILLVLLLHLKMLRIGNTTGILGNRFCVLQKSGLDKETTLQCDKFSTIKQNCYCQYATIGTVIQLKSLSVLYFLHVLF